MMRWSCRSTLHQALNCKALPCVWTLPREPLQKRKLMSKRSISDIGVLTLGAVGLAATTLGTLAVVSRYTLSLPISFSDEVVTYLVVWALLIGVGLGERENTHIRATIVLEMLGPRAQRWCEFATLLLTVSFALVMIWCGGLITYQRLALGEVSATILQFPQWIARASILVGFALALVATLSRLRRPAARVEAIV
ncbi:MAG: TRAP transporter small permease [Betaproteobacteria bacterium]|nr:TRAP transporter small permease [Betaproteobacteria bacterium]